MPVHTHTHNAKEHNSVFPYSREDGLLAYVFYASPLCSWTGAGLLLGLQAATGEHKCRQSLHSTLSGKGENSARLRSPGASGTLSEQSLAEKIK